MTIRVGFLLAVRDPQWIGGINYIKNLVHCIRKYLPESIVPVVVASPFTHPSILNSLLDIEIITSRLVDSTTTIGKISKFNQRVFGRDPMIELFLKAHKIDLISHSGHLGRDARVPTIGWIPDFQHIRLPKFFLRDEIRERDARFERLCRWCTTIIVSSEDARKDLEMFFPPAKKRAAVLRFVSLLEDESAIPDEQEIRQKLNLSLPYFHLPNQFWSHKNHDVVLDAIKILKDLHRLNFLIVATGSKKDRRQPQHFKNMEAKIRALGLEEYFLTPGLLPYSDMKALMKNSIGVINPSLFEGWSTSVEEAKTLGKAIILSDIPVHVEQDPKKAYYFDPSSPSNLAEVLASVSSIYSKNADTRDQVEALTMLNVRAKEFAVSYQFIVFETLKRFKNS